jgi:hypothetical protein
MGLEGQELSKTQILTTGQSVEATSQLASVHSYEQQELVHRYRRQTVDQWAGILCPSPVSPQPMEPEGLCRSSDQNGTYPDIASGSPSTIPGRKDGSPYSAKFTERMELDGPATRSSPSPDTANIMDREYEGEVYPENPETPNQSLDDEFTDNEVPTADNSASEEDSASSKKTGEVTPEASSAIARFNGAGEKGGVGKDSRFKGKVRSVVARVKRALRWTACAKKKTCGKLRCKVKRLRGCDAPHA